MASSRAQFEFRLLAVAFLLLASSDCNRKTPWEALPLGTSADFREIRFTDADHGFIAGGSYQITGGLIGRTSDGGKTWHFTSDLTSRESASVTALHFFDSAHGILATSTGVLLSTNDGGESWTAVDRRGRYNMLTTLFFLNDRRGWAAGHGDVLTTDDGGQTWKPLRPEGVDTNYRAQMRALWFQDEQRGWSAGMNASLERTADGGVTWERAALPFAKDEHPSFWDMFFVDQQRGWVVGEEGTILVTKDAGATWTRLSTGLKDAKSAPKLERIPRAGGVDVIDAGDRTPGFTITAVRFLDSNRGWIAGFYAGLGHSLILRTEDAGASWATDGDVSGEELYTLFVQGSERLWAVGARVREGAQSIYRRTLTK